MKIRDSGMPEEEVWNSFFDPMKTLQQLGLTNECCDLVEFGCGYGTFTISAAQIISGMVHTFEIEKQMISTTSKSVSEAGLSNVTIAERDFVAQGTGLADGSCDYALLLNILHGENPVVLLTEAYRNLRNGGLVGVMHWNYDPTTPRGPEMHMRSKPKQIISWAKEAGLTLVGDDIIDFPPYHYGMVLQKPTN